MIVIQMKMAMVPVSSRWLSVLVLFYSLAANNQLVASQATTPFNTPEITSDLPSPTTITTTTTTSASSIPTAQVNCMASTRCQTRILEFYDPKCLSGLECQCVAQNSTGYIDCLKEKCPRNWAEIHHDDMALCEQMGVDMSGDTTYTADLGVPTNLFNGTGFGLDSGSGKSELSQSDKIAIGIGVGIGVPTLIVTLCAWLCVVPKWRARRAGGDDNESKDRKTTANGLDSMSCNGS